MPQASSTITLLASFTGANGELPNDLVRDGSGNLFGTTDAGGASGDGTVFEIAAPLPTTTTLTSSANPAVFGQAVTFTATVGAGSSMPTGSVAFYDNGTLLGNGSLNASGVATWSASTLSLGSQTIRADYGGDSNYAGSASAAWSQIVNQATTTTSLTSSVNPASSGQTVTFTATVSVNSPGSGTATGTVTFYDNGSTLSSGTLNGSGVATYSTSTLPAGNQSITASYNGASNFAGSTSTNVPQVVNQAPAFTSATATTFTTTAVGNFTVRTSGYPNAAVTESGPLPAGVTFTSNSDGTATLSGTPAAGSNGTYPLTFTANNGINPQATQSFTLTVNQASTTTALTPSANPSVTGQSVTFTATVSGSSGTPTPTGSVTFYANGTPLGSDTLNASGVATWSTSTLSVGSQTITADYGGDSNYAGSTSANLTQTVNKAATTTSRMSSVNPSVFGQTVTFTATVSASSPGSGIPTGTVTFYANGTFLGNGTLNGSRVPDYSTAALSLGSQTITANYGGDANYTSSTSTALTQTVNQADTTTSLTSSVETAVYGQEVTFTAIVTANCPGSGTPTGTVTFTDASGSYPETLVDGEANWTTSALAVRDTTVTASYGGSTEYTSSYDVVSQTVSQAATTTDLTASPEEATAGQTVTFTATVAVVEPGAGTPTGNVLFLEDDEVLGEEAVNSDGVATLDVSDLTANMEHSITAEYEGDTNFAVSTSDPVLVTVASISTTTAVVVDPASPTEGDPVTLTATVSPASVYADEAPTGTVTFTCGDLTLGTVDLNQMVDADQAVLITTDLPAGDQTITATYGGDDTYEASCGTTDVTITAPTAWGLTADVPDDDPMQGYLVPEGEANIDLNQGGVRISHPLDFSQSAAARADASFALAYNSATVNHPIVVNAVLDTDAAAGTPTEITAVLSVDGVPGSPIDIPTTDYVAGEPFDLPPIEAPSPGTGEHTWELDVQLTLADDSTVTETATGTMTSLDQTSSPYGSGWSISGIDQLIPTTDGVLWVSGGGDSRLFTGSGSGTYANPVGDFGTLVENADGSFTYTAKNQNVEQFDAAGYEVSLTYPTGQGWNFTYTEETDANGGLAGVTGPDGGVTSFTYDTTTGLLASITEPGDRTLTFIESSTDLTGIVDVDGSRRTLGYSNHLLTSDDWAPWQTTFGYNDLDQVDAVDLGGVQGYTVAAADANGVAAISDYYGNTTTYMLDPSGRLLAEQLPGEAAQTWVYDANGQVVTYTDARDQTTTYVYVYGAYNSTLGGGDGDLIEVIDPNSDTQTYRYDPTYHNVLSSQDEDGDITVNGYDAYGDLTSTTTAYGTLSAATTTSTWAGGLLQSTTDADGNTTYYTYNRLDQVTAQVTTDVHGTIVDDEVFTYDDAGYTTSITVGVGALNPEVTYTTYDGKGQLLSQRNPAGDTSLTSYAAAGDVLSTTDGNGVTTLYVYNGADQQIEVIADANQLLPEPSYTVYDRAGNVTETIDADGNYTVNTYNQDNQLLTSTTYDANGTVIGFQANTYDDNGNVVTSVDGDGNVTRNTYDDENRLVSTATFDFTGHLVSSQATTYDGDDNILTQTDGDGNVTTNTWNAAGQLASVVLRDRIGTLISATYYSYDGNGNVLSTTDGDGTTTVDTLNGQGQVVSEKVYDSPFLTNLIVSAAASYDLKGNEVTSIDGDGNVTTNTYDGDNRVVLSVVTDATGAVVSSVTYTYDGDGNVLTATDGDGNVSTNTYDDNDNLLTSVVTDLHGNIISLVSNSYDGDNNLLTSTDGDGNLTVNTYDGSGNVLTSKQYDANGHLIGSMVYSYDLAGNVLTTTDGDGTRTVDSYDDDELGGETVLNSSGVISSASEQLDQAGNVVRSVDGDGNVTEETYDGNQLMLTTTTDPVGNLISSMAYTYDAAGNVLTTMDGDGNVTINTYDGDNLLTTKSYDASGHLVSGTAYTYDGAGNVLTIVDGDGNTTINTYSGNLLIGQTVVTSIGTVVGSETEQYDGDGEVVRSVDGDGNVTEDTYDGNQLMLTTTTDPLGHLISSMAYTYDAAGNTLTTTDGDGNVTVNTYDGNNLLTTKSYDAIGNLVSSTAYTYDAAGNVLTTIDGDGNKITNTYNANQLIGQTVVTSIGTVVSSETEQYDEDGDVVRFVDGNGNVTADTYDGNQLMLTTTTDPVGHLISSMAYTYDAAGNILTTTDGDGNTTVNTYDGNNLMTTKSYDASGHLISSLAYTYDGVGNVLTTTDGDGTEDHQHLQWQPAGRADSSPPALGPWWAAKPRSTTRTATWCGSVDGDGNVTEDTYDGNQLVLTTTTDPLGHLISSMAYTYDAAGNTLTSTDGDGNTTINTYDGDNLLTTKSYDASGHLVSGTAYTYDGAGNVLTTTDGDGTEDHQYLQWQPADRPDGGHQHWDRG